MSLFAPKLVVTDIDGVWTDGGMFYDEQGYAFKRFNTYDSAGVLWLRKSGIPLAICSGEDSNGVRARAKKLNIDHVMVGISNKVDSLSKLISELGIEWSEVAYVGDDINDIAAIQLAGFTACPNSAPDYIKARVHLVLDKNGGEGAFREFVERLLGQEKVLEILGDFAG